MTNFERVKQENVSGMAKIIVNEFCGMCRSCEYYYRPECRFDEEANVVNEGACEKGIKEWLNKES